MAQILQNHKYYRLKYKTLLKRTIAISDLQKGDKLTHQFQSIDNHTKANKESQKKQTNTQVKTITIRTSNKYTQITM